MAKSRGGDMEGNAGPYTKAEYGVIRNSAIVSLGPATNQAGAKAYAKRQGLTLMSRPVGEWKEVK